MNGKTNWWKWGCIVALILFETAREFAVLQAYEPIHGAALKDVQRFGGYVSAQGEWRRADPGDQLSGPTVVRIQCWQEKAQCSMAQASPRDGYITPPAIDTFDAQFAPDAVTFQDDSPACVTYRYRIDTKDKIVTGVREKKDSFPGGMDKACAELESRIDLELASSPPDDGMKVMSQHFVPLIAATSWILRYLGGGWKSEVGNQT